MTDCEENQNEIKIAICFWGLCRSTKYTIDSINKNIFVPLIDNEIKFDILLHTNTYKGLYYNTWSGEKNVQLDNDAWKLLNPSQYIIEDQEKDDLILDLPKYRRHGDPWDQPNFNALNNFIRALWSMNKVTSLWKDKKGEYTHVIYLRSDVFYENPLLMSYFQNLQDNEILLPDFEKFPVNDRFAIGKPDVMEIYGERFNKAYEFSLLYPLHAETYLNHTLKENKIIIREIDFKFHRVSVDGKNRGY
jgi:hypothetical protein